MRMKDTLVALLFLFCTHCIPHSSRSGQNIDRDLRSWLGTKEGGPVEQIHPGDVTWFAANEKHRHGASPTDSHRNLRTTELVKLLTA